MAFIYVGTVTYTDADGNHLYTDRISITANEDSIDSAMHYTAEHNAPEGAAHYEYEVNAVETTDW